jgi:hypothetical protein
LQLSAFVSLGYLSHVAFIHILALSPHILMSFLSCLSVAGVAEIAKSCKKEIKGSEQDQSQALHLPSVKERPG